VKYPGFQEGLTVLLDQGITVLVPWKQ